jgi:hypothetical protein
VRSVTAQCENGWKVRVSSLEGEPFITLELAGDNRITAKTFIARETPDGLALVEWHPYNHTDG